MNRIMIIGNGGSGKSTFSRKLHKLIGIELIHLDKYFWKPDWKETADAEWFQIVSEISNKEQWIIDGNYSNTIDIRLNRADTIIYFDFPTYICMLRSLKRLFQVRVFQKNRTDITDGCLERLDLTYYKWVLNFNKLNRKTFYKKLNEVQNVKNVLIFRKNKDIQDYLKQITQI